MENHFISSPAVDLGLLEYDKALTLQKKLVSVIKKGILEKAIIFVEHPPVYTIGRKPDPQNYAGIDPVVTERGGDITYHGPGQLVVYPIMDVRSEGKLDIRAFVNRIMDTVIETLSDLGIRAEKGTNEPGIWVMGKKMGSVGIAIDEFVSYHGISLNISREVLAGFSKIRPCGMDAAVMSFMNIEREDMIKSLMARFSSHFGNYVMVSLPDLKTILSGFPSDFPDAL